MIDHGDIIRGSPNERATMKLTILQKVQYLIQERNHERAMREVLQLIKPSAYENNTLNFQSSSQSALTSSGLRPEGESVPRSRHKWSYRRHCRGSGRHREEAQASREFHHANGERLGLGQY